MYELPPDKRAAPGAPKTTEHTLGADHVNELNKLVKRSSRNRTGVGGIGYHGGAVQGSVTLQNQRLAILHIVHDVISVYDTDDSGLYLAQRRYWNSSDPAGHFGRWQSKQQLDNFNLIVDAREFGFLNIGDKLVCYEDLQRNAWIPIGVVPCYPMVDLGAIDTTALPVHTAVEGAIAVYQLEVSYDGGASWFIVNNRQWTLDPDKDAGGESSGSGFATVVVTHQTRLRLTAFRSDKGRAQINLAGASMRLEAICQGGKSIASNIPSGSPHVVMPWDFRHFLNNTPLNGAVGMPAFEVFGPDQIRVLTPLLEPDNEFSGREYWTIAVDFGIAVACTDYDTPLVDINFTPTGAIDEAGNDTGDFVAVQLELNDKTIQERHVFMNPSKIEDSSQFSNICSATGFVTFEAEDGDVVRLTAYKGVNAAFDAEMHSGSLRLEVKTDESVANTLNGNDGGYSVYNGTNVVAQVNNDAGANAAGWPTFDVDDAEVTITVPQGKWTIEAEFTATVSTTDEQSSSSSSSSVSTSNSSLSQSVSTSSSDSSSSQSDVSSSSSLSLSVSTLVTSLSSSSLSSQSFP